LLIVVAGAVYFWLPQASEPAEPPTYVPPENNTAMDGTGSTTTPPVQVVAENLTIPWEVLFLPDEEILVTERPGRLVRLPAGTQIDVPGVVSTGEGGLLGAALHPDFANNGWLYLYETREAGLGLQNEIARYRLVDDVLRDREVILDNLPGAIYHDGGRLAFGPDGFLYATVGDATDAEAAQDTSNLAGTIIRMTATGEPAPGNPNDGSYIYSYGHRNPQGLAWDTAGRLWSTEHGRSVGGSGFDEINRITPGGNYGWPDSQGDTVAPGTIAPVRHSTADVTWAPAGAAYVDGSLYMPGLRGETLYEAELDGEEIVGWHEHLVGEYGRLRTVVVGPEGWLYVTTSNRDGRGDAPAENDDKILRIDPARLER
jgi:glucose/arabinose dehydrogenase